MSSPKTIFCDIDGTLVEHTGDIIKNYQAANLNFFQRYFNNKWFID